MFNERDVAIDYNVVANLLYMMELKNSRDHLTS